MIIEINKLPYRLTDQQEAMLMGLLHGKLLEEYERLEPTWRLAAKAVARGALDWIEKRVRQSSGSEVARAVRPGKGVDPVPHLALIGSRLLSDMGRHVVISFETCTDEWGKVPNSIENFTVTLTSPDTSQNGGQVDPHGHIGIGQNDSTQIPGPDVREPVPDRQALHSGLKT